MNFDCFQTTLQGFSFFSEVFESVFFESRGKENQSSKNVLPKKIESTFWIFLSYHKCDENVIPVNICSWDRQFIYFVRNVPSSLIVQIPFKKCILSFRLVFERNSDPCMFPKF